MPSNPHDNLPINTFKMPKATTPATARQRRHNPLEDDIVATGILKAKSGKKRARGSNEADDEHFVDSRASKNILRIGRELAAEDSAENVVPKQTIDQFGYDSRFDDEADEENKVYDDDETWGDDDDEIVEEIEVDPNDLDMYKKFMPDEEDDLLKHGWDRKPSGDGEGEAEESVNLADLIMEKIAAHEAAETRRETVGAPVDDYELPPKVVEVYTK